MMILILFVNCVIASDSVQDTSVLHHGQESKNVLAAPVGRISLGNPMNYNTTYIDKAENLLRIPNYYDDRKKKKPKKIPKRTVQKIIKKNRGKNKKMFMNLATKLPTLTSFVDGDTYPQRSEDITTEVTQKKKGKKYSKYVRHQMPFQKLQRKEGHRYKRQTDRDLFILEDLDEIEFLSQEKDMNIVKTHVKKYW